jgi:hypothetical protein
MEFRTMLCVDLRLNRTEKYCSEVSPVTALVQAQIAAEQVVSVVTGSDCRDACPTAEAIYKRSCGTQCIAFLPINELMMRSVSMLLAFALAVLLAAPACHAGFGPAGMEPSSAQAVYKLPRDHAMHGAAKFYETNDYMEWSVPRQMICCMAVAAVLWHSILLGDSL